MARYPKRQKVKRYHRSFYSPGMWVKKAVGIIVLVAVVLVVGWLAAPHVLDWATHTWYTVVRDRDLPHPVPSARVHPPGRRAPLPANRQLPRCRKRSRSPRSRALIL